jgi:P27 family predicted phage terminase small subunit
MYDAGFVTRLDRAVLAAYCQAWANWCEYTESVDRYGSVVKGSKGQPRVSPFVKLRDDARRDMIKFAAELGITPSARSRVSAVPPQDKSDPAKKYF